jgi:hypothetical protein
LQAYERGLAIRKTLAESDPSNSQWQRDLSVSCTKLSEVAEKSGKRALALDWAKKSLAIDEKLVELDPSNAIWRKDLAISQRMVARLSAAS